jgi:hypothetical protein
MIPGCIIPKSLNDTIWNLPTIKDPPAGPPKGDPRTTPTSSIKAISADDAVNVLRGVAEIGTQSPQQQEYLAVGDAGGGTRQTGGTGAAMPIVVSNNGPQYKNLGNLADADIMAIAFLVMMDAAKSAQEDLKSIMDGVKAINSGKEGDENPWKRRKT